MRKILKLSAMLSLSMLLATNVFAQTNANANTSASTTSSAKASTQSNKAQKKTASAKKTTAPKKQATKKNTSKSNKSSTAKKVATGAAATGAAVAATASNNPLKQFNDSVRIRLIERGINPKSDGKMVVLANYEVENLSNNAIKSVNWISVFVSDKEEFFGQDIPLDLSKNPLKPKEKSKINLTFPLDGLPERAKELFLNPDAPIHAVVGAKSITFSNGKTIEVK